MDNALRNCVYVYAEHNGDMQIDVYAVDVALYDYARINVLLFADFRAPPLRSLATIDDTP